MSGSWGSGLSMLATAGLLLPLAVAAAFSTIPLAAVTIILLSEHARRNGLAYLIGLAASTYIVTFALSFGIAALPTSSNHLRGILLAVGEILLGILLVIYGIVILRRRPSANKSSGKWLAALDRAPLWTALGGGFIMSLRPKALLLSIAAGVAIAKSDLRVEGILIVVGVFTLVSVSTVAGPVIFTLVSPVRARIALTAAKDFITRNGRLLTFIVSLLVGVVLIGDGLTRF